MPAIRSGTATILGPNSRSREGPHIVIHKLQCSFQDSDIEKAFIQFD
jgi:hypothetical protein